jgi:hypothetical protein
MRDSGTSNFKSHDETTGSKVILGKSGPHPQLPYLRTDDIASVTFQHFLLQKLIRPEVRRGTLADCFYLSS